MADGLWRKLTRRELMKLGAGGMLAGGAGIALGFFGGARYERYERRVPPRAQPFSPSVFLAIDEDGTTTIWVTRSEMGQGVRTALPMIVAEELGADWSRVRVEQAPASRSYGAQATVASTSVSSLWPELREAGAIARAMLITAAARTWGVRRSRLGTEDGAVIDRSTGRRLPFGALAPLAGTLRVPRSAPLKRASDFRLVGTARARLDTPEKTDGSARFGLDVRQPGMLFASIERPPELGAALARFDATRALAIEGVREVIEIDGGVAVIAESTWLALRGRRALEIEWRAGEHRSLSSAAMARELRELALEGDGATARSDGDVEAALARAAQRIDAVYEVPYLAHACMEPINCTARVHDGVCEVWAPTQDPQAVQEAAAELTGLGLAECHVHVTLIGGGFGRRAQRREAEEAVRLAVHASPRPVQLVWSREDDLRHDFYRHAAAHAFAIGLDADGRPIAWRDRIASPSMMGVSSSLGRVDDLAVDGASALPYAIENVEVRWREAEQPMPLGIWRSVGHSFNAFAVEAAIDECAVLAGTDPVRYRLDLLRRHRTHRAVLERAARMAGWDDGPPSGRGRGVAVHACFGSTCAQVAEVSLENGRLRVHRVWAAVECGRAINPRTIEAQIEGGIAFGLSAALYGDIHVERGRVIESNFHDYRVLRIDEMPEVHVEILESQRAPSGIGELGVPMIAPAVVNALHAATGVRVRRLPIAVPG